MNGVRVQSSADGRVRSPGGAAAPSAVSCAHPDTVPAVEVANAASASAGIPVDRLKQRLSRALLNTFYELTGLHLHAWWPEPAVAGPWGGLAILCPKARQRHAEKLPDRCQTCLRNRWPCAWNGQKPEKRFAGLCGSLNYCACVKAFDRPRLTLTVQQPAPVCPARRRGFLRAVHLTRVVLHDLEAMVEAGQVSHLAPPPNERGPAAGGTPALRWRAGNRPQGTARAGEDEPATGILQPGHHHGQVLVQQMLGYIHEHYSHPIRLTDLAANVRLRPSYACSLFSTTLGVTFHHYLEQCRLAKAKDLLRDPVKRVAEVAYAVGYTNPNHFRNVFTARVGLPPSVWREAPAAANSPTA